MAPAAWCTQYVWCMMQRDAICKCFLVLHQSLRRGLLTSTWLQLWHWILAVRTSVLACCRLTIDIMSSITLQLSSSQVLCVIGQYLFLHGDIDPMSHLRLLQPRIKRLGTIA